MKIAKTISSVLRDGVRRIKVLVTGAHDIQTDYEAMPFGVDGVPPQGWKALHISTSIKSKSVIVGYINRGQLDSLVEGENRFYSTNNDGDISTSIYMRGDGTMEIGGTDDYMVRYNELEISFNQLKEDHNDLVSAFNSHMHPTAATGAPSPPTPIPSSIPATPSTADISPAKIEEIKTL